MRRGGVAETGMQFGALDWIDRDAHASKLARQLAILNVAKAPEEMDQPGWKLHHLIGRGAGSWSVWVNGNWRLTFKFTGEDAEVVDYQDYH